MEAKFIANVYYTLAGQLEEDACVPGVASIFEDGMLCDRLYCDALDAYERLRARLGVQDEDPDVEIIMNAFFSICEEMCYHMYRYGAKFEKEQP